MSRSVPDPVQGVRDFIDAPEAGKFDALALEVIRYQATHCVPYANFLRSRGVDPGAVRHWQDIPPIPVAAFKETTLATAPPTRVFRTSGTTRGEAGRGAHHLPSTDLYDRSWPEPFRRALLWDRERMLTFALIPAPADAPESSLAYMCAGALERFGEEGSRCVLGRDGLDVNGLALSLAQVSEYGTPVLLLATSLALDDFLNRLLYPVMLAKGSRIMDTGGFKGRTRKVTRAGLFERAERMLGIPESHIVGEYGMTELCSQLYENTLARHLADPRAPLSRLYLGPPWMRTRVLDPETLRPRAPGETGLLAHCDLANAWTVSWVVTEDLGVEVDGGFQLRGRITGAPPRGCSLTTEELLG